ncbi:hypothetical protein BKA70DRAFT_1423389 [Coprinopsis sp. MPI-PUGE-AT-0042]|nr:hypothetical protein BKA70DRAFT_1423389 [Coprinopsis sp. MPI-PUGE-AT-0042]
MASKIAVVYSVHGKPPSLSSGEITPAVAKKFEQQCLSYFDAKDVPADKQVSRILGGLEDVQVSHWVNTNRATLVAGTFSEFMTAFRLECLEANWSEKLEAKLCNYKQDGRGTAEEMSDKETCKALYSLMDKHLRHRANKKEIKDLTSLKAWIEAVTAEDISARHNAAYYQNSNKRQKTNNGSYVKTGSSLSNNTNSGSGGGSGNDNSSSGRLFPPKRTEKETNFLFWNSGCLKCRRLFVDHQSKQCPNGFPDGKGYITIC